jgi:acetoacetate decarboxylase
MTSVHPQAGRRYLMPVIFGPTHIPDVSSIPDVQTVSLSFQTESDALRPLMPSYFQLPDKPVVMVSAIDYRDVDYLGGRSYREVLVGVNATFHEEKGTIRAPYMFVLWVTEYLALVSGREYMGHAKLMGEIPPLEERGDEFAFSCAEYGATLIEGRAFNLNALEGEALEKMRAATAVSSAFGWKYIQSSEGPADADYPVLNTMCWNYERIWSGTGSLMLFKPDRNSAPASSAVMESLATLPGTERCRAFVARGSVRIDRTATRRLYQGDDRK